MSHIRSTTIHYFFGIIILHLLSSADAYAKAPAAFKPSLLSGTWHCAISYGEWTIERKSDGTFSKNGKLVRTLGEPAVPFSVAGSWRLEGKNYIEVWEKVSPAGWRGINNIEKRSRVVSISPGRFSRVENDSPVFIEILVSGRNGK
jgi:hypothetical protein